MPIEVDMKKVHRRRHRLYWRIRCLFGFHDWGDNCYWDSDEVWLSCYQCGKDMNRAKSDALIKQWHANELDKEEENRLSHF